MWIDMKWLYYTHDGIHQSKICAVLRTEPRTPSQTTPFLLERDAFVPQREPEIRSHAARAGLSATVSATSGLVSNEGHMLRAQSSTQTTQTTQNVIPTATQSHVATGALCGAQSCQAITKPSRPTLPLPRASGMREWWGVGMCYSATHDFIDFHSLAGSWNQAFACFCHVFWCFLYTDVTWCHRWNRSFKTFRRPKVQVISCRLISCPNSSKISRRYLDEQTSGAAKELWWIIHKLVLVCFSWVLVSSNFIPRQSFDPVCEQSRRCSCVYYGRGAQIQIANFLDCAKCKDSTIPDTGTCKPDEVTWLNMIKHNLGIGNAKENQRTRHTLLKLQQSTPGLWRRLLMSWPLTSDRKLSACGPWVKWIDWLDLDTESCRSSWEMLGDWWRLWWLWSMQDRVLRRLQQAWAKWSTARDWQQTVKV